MEDFYANNKLFETIERNILNCIAKLFGVVHTYSFDSTGISVELRLFSFVWLIQYVI